MASFVNVQCPNGRRQKIKLTAQMTLLQVIQEVCKKQDLDSNKYNLKHQRKVLDSSLTIRFANLPNNAHLELIESAEENIHSAKKCVVALQLENGERLVHEFMSDNTLFDVLIHCKSKSESLTFDETLDGVVCIYTNQQIIGLEKLQTTTLSMIGLSSGRGVIRLIQPAIIKPDESDDNVIKTDTTTRTVDEATSSPQESTSVKEQESTETMDVASSCSTSSMSLASQVNEGDGRQLSETMMDHGSHLQAVSSETKEKEGRNDDTMDVELSVGKLNEASQSENENAGLKKKSGKKEPMEIEQHKQQAGGSGKKVRNTCKVDTDTQVDIHPAPLEFVATTSDGRTSRTSSEVLAFTGIGRTLSENGPDNKKPRFHSPPSSSKNSQESQQLLNIEGSENMAPLEREPVAFQLGDTGSMISSQDEVSDDFFEVTIDDLRLMLKGLKNERTAEQPLMTAKMREELEKSKMEKYNRVAIRVYFPDRTVLQGFFSPKETISAVTSFVKENLERDTDFYLYTTPPRTILNKPNKTLFEAKLFPAAIIHFGSHETQGRYLHSRLLENVGDFTSANEKLGNHNRSQSSSTQKIQTDASISPQINVQSNHSEKEDKTLSSSTEQDDQGGSNTGKNNSKTVPKWFKLGK